MVKLEVLHFIKKVWETMLPCGKYGAQDQVCDHGRNFCKPCTFITCPLMKKIQEDLEDA